jgi:hypothetical protein
MPSLTRTARLGLLAALLAALAGCASVVAPPAPALERGARWSVLPIRNDTETALAGQRAGAIVDSVLRAHGLAELVVPPAPHADALAEDDGAQALEQALAWAREQKVRYAVTGTVTEWRYKVGVDGEPAVGLTLQLLEVESGRVLWSASGGRSGFSRESLAGVAQDLVQKLTAPLSALR